MAKSAMKDQSEYYVKTYGKSLKTIALIYADLIAQNDVLGLAFVTKSLDAIINNARVTYDRKTNTPTTVIN